MDRNTLPSAAENEIRFLLSLLNIATPGEPLTPQAAAIEQMAATSR
ncbi:MAG: hypothetical protein LAO79_23395 [Acidobacteriia bacterium]|nr:hypothetical protein [Terriglobia bacterium]